VFPRGLGDEVGLPRYHLYGIADVIPFKYIALEVFPEKGGSYGNPKEWMSFDGVLFIDLLQKTKVVFLMVDVQMGQRDEEERRRRKQELDGGHKLIRGYFDNLTRLVEKGF
jgi:hypothetical protein